MTGYTLTFTILQTDSWRTEQADIGGTMDEPEPGQLGYHPPVHSLGPGKVKLIQCLFERKRCRLHPDLK